MNDFEKAVSLFVEGCQEKLNAYFVEAGLTHTKPDTIKVQEGGRKYLKVIRQGTQNSVHCFINIENGDVLKAASFRSPAKHARGNIYDETNGLSKMTAFGPEYL